jgi:hypothetical protein
MRAKGMPYDLFIIAKQERALYEYLAKQFTGRADVEVTLDRREAQRRQRAEPRDPERRRADRRSRSRIDADLESLGVVVLPLR